MDFNDDSCCGCVCRVLFAIAMLYFVYKVVEILIIAVGYAIPFVIGGILLYLGILALGFFYERWRKIRKEKILYDFISTNVPELHQNIIKLKDLANDMKSERDRIIQAMENIDVNPFQDEDVKNLNYQIANIEQKLLPDMLKSREKIYIASRKTTLINSEQMQIKINEVNQESSAIVDDALDGYKAIRLRVSDGQR